MSEFIFNPTTEVPPSERAILDQWDSNTNPLVSITCIAFNQEAYIRDALNGFLSQKTEFPFEILIHDDASTDGTAKIIREYELRYPRIVKPIYQQENQHSIGIRIHATYNYPRAKGRYLAYCEGDDYWIDRNKLQRQVLAIADSPQKSRMCFHPVWKRYQDGTVQSSRRISCRQRYVSAQELLELGLAIVPTCSLLVERSLIVDEYGQFLKGNGGSFLVKFLAIADSPAIYLPQPMAVYRVSSVGSHTQRVQENAALRSSVVDRLNRSLLEADKLTSQKHTRLITDVVRRRIMAFLLDSTVGIELKNRMYQEWRSVLSINNKVGYDLFVVVTKIFGQRIGGKLATAVRQVSRKVKSLSDRRPWTPQLKDR